MQFKPSQSNPGLEFRRWGHPAVTDRTVKVGEAKGGDWVATQRKWGMTEVDKYTMTG